MAAPSTEPQTNGDTTCSYHPNVRTRLRCSRCGKPICPQCAVRTEVGLRCPDCAGVRGLPTYRTPPGSLAKAVGGGLIVAVLVALLWWQFPIWNFYLALLLGFGVVETMARIVREKRGRDLQIATIAVIAFGLVLSRVLLAQQYGVSFAEINDLDDFVLTPEVIEEFGGAVAVTDLLYLNLMPDGLFAIMALLIGFVRFR